MGFRRFAFDTALSVMVFVPLTAIWNLTVNNVSAQALVVVCLGALALNLAAGGFYGRLLDWWRGKLGYSSA